MVDVALSPFAESLPDAFLTTQRLPMPALQGAVLALAWVLVGYAMRTYNPRLTRGDALAAATACLVTWLGSVFLVLGGLYVLGEAGAGPGPLDVAELSFYTGSITVLGGWRWVVWQSGGSVL
jgi:hypothetical protein